MLTFSKRKHRNLNSNNIYYNFLCSISICYLIKVNSESNITIKYYSNVDILRNAIQASRVIFGVVVVYKIGLCRVNIIGSKNHSNIFIRKWNLIKENEKCAIIFIRLNQNARQKYYKPNHFASVSGTGTWCILIFKILTMNNVLRNMKSITEFSSTVSPV